MRKTTLILQPLLDSDVPPAPPEPTNEALIIAIQKGDGIALWQLFRRHADLLGRIIARELPEESDTESVLQGIFEDIRDRAVHYTPDKGRALGWLMTVARQRAKDHASRIPITRPLLEPTPSVVYLEDREEYASHAPSITPAFA